MDKVLGWKLYECLREYYKYYLPFDENPVHNPADLLPEVFDYFKLGEEEE